MAARASRPQKKRSKRSVASAAEIGRAMESVTSSAKRVHVISRRDGWAVKREGASRAYKIYDSKERAISRAKSLATRGSCGDIVIHKTDGTIQKWEKVKKSKR